jgi:hypothetical protein
VAPAEIKAGSVGATVRPNPAQPEAGGVAVEQCRAWLSWAVAQVDACLISDKLASAQVLAAIGDVLAPPRVPAGSAPAPAGDADGKMSAVIIAVQSHDRVMQGLAHVARMLAMSDNATQEAGEADVDSEGTIELFTIDPDLHES